jgi:hypothetical protein
MKKDATPVNDPIRCRSFPASRVARMPEEVTLSKDEILRYSRHLIMPEVGMEGQLKLKKASVLLVGTGGLGAPLGCISRRRASAASAWSISTWSISPTCSAR